MPARKVNYRDNKSNDKNATNAYLAGVAKRQSRILFLDAIKMRTTRALLKKGISYAQLCVAEMNPTTFRNQRIQNPEVNIKEGNIYDWISKINPQILYIDAFGSGKDIRWDILDLWLKRADSTDFFLTISARGARGQTTNKRYRQICDKISKYGYTPKLVFGYSGQKTRKGKPASMVFMHFNREITSCVYRTDKIIDVNDGIVSAKLKSFEMDGIIKMPIEEYRRNLIKIGELS